MCCHHLSYFDIIIQSIFYFLILIFLSYSLLANFIQPFLFDFWGEMFWQYYFSLVLFICLQFSRVYFLPRFRENINIVLKNNNVLITCHHFQPALWYLWIIKNYYIKYSVDKSLHLLVNFNLILRYEKSIN